MYIFYFYADEENKDSKLYYSVEVAYTWTSVRDNAYKFETFMDAADEIRENEYVDCIIELV
jgi:hypothetical protein